MKRVAALIGAIAMIVVAIVVRGAIDDDDDDGSSSSPRTIACVTELAAACKRLTGVTVRVEDAAVTARALAKGTAGIDGWVTFDPWPAMAALLAQHDVVKRTTAIARSDLAIAMVSERAEALVPECGGNITWKCVGDAAGRNWSDVGGKAEWGTVRVGLPPITSGEGAITFASATSNYVGRTDFATNDLVADDGFPVWKTKLLATPGTFSEFLLQFPAKFSAVGTISALANPGVRANEVTFIPSGASAVVVITDVSGRVVDDLRRLLKQDGWDDFGPSGLPEPGVVLALSGLTG